MGEEKLCCWRASGEGMARMGNPGSRVCAGWHSSSASCTHGSPGTIPVCFQSRSGGKWVRLGPHCGCAEILAADIGWSPAHCSPFSKPLTLSVHDYGTVGGYHKGN